MNHTDYYPDLTLHLRSRGLDDNTIAAALREIQDLSRESGQSPEEAFGPAKEYAKTFPDRIGVTAKITGSPSRRLFMATLYLLMIVNAVNLSFNFTSSDRGYDGLVLLLGSGLILFLIVMVGAMFDRRLPKGFALEQETR